MDHSLMQVEETKQQQQQQQLMQQHHAIVVVAKCPIPGKSKTRLIPMLGEAGSSQLAKAMLSDVLVTLSECNQLRNMDDSDDGNQHRTVQKILFYAPADDHGRTIMSRLLKDLGLSEHVDDDDDRISGSGSSSDGWMLLPMVKSTNLRATHLGDILTDILQRTRQLFAGRRRSRGLQQDSNESGGKVLFLGMDSPELPLEEMIASLNNNEQSEAVLCPANDGGYGMLSVPLVAPTDCVFRGIRWSDPLTALGQIKALTDCNPSVKVRLGRLMNDIDEPEDVTAICQRLATMQQDSSDTQQSPTTATNNEEKDVLLQSSTASGPTQTGGCRHTIRVLKELKLI